MDRKDWENDSICKRAKVKAYDSLMFVYHYTKERPTKIVLQIPEPSDREVKVVYCTAHYGNETNTFPITISDTGDVDK